MISKEGKRTLEIFKEIQDYAVENHITSYSKMLVLSETKSDVWLKALRGHKILFREFFASLRRISKDNKEWQKLEELVKIKGDTFLKNRLGKSKFEAFPYYVLSERLDFFFPTKEKFATVLNYILRAKDYLLYQYSFFFSRRARSIPNK